MEKAKRARQAWYVSYNRRMPGYDSTISDAVIYEHPLLWKRREEKRPGAGFVSILFWEKIPAAVIRKIRA